MSVHSAFVFNKCLYIFGGYNGLRHQHFNDLHMYNPLTREWTNVSTQGEPPCPRHSQSCNLVRSQLFLFAGVGGWNCTHSLTDLFVLDLSPSLETLAFKHNQEEVWRLRLEEEVRGWRSCCVII